MMSGKATLADAVRATRLGAFQFLEKPLTPETVLATVRAAVDIASTRAELRQRFLAMVEQRGRPYGIVVRKLDRFQAVQIYEFVKGHCVCLSQSLA